MRAVGSSPAGTEEGSTPTAAKPRDRLSPTLRTKGSTRAPYSPSSAAPRADGSGQDAVPPKSSGGRMAKGAFCAPSGRTKAAEKAEVLNRLVVMQVSWTPSARRRWVTACLSHVRSVIIEHPFYLPSAAQSAAGIYRGRHKGPRPAQRGASQKDRRQRAAEFVGFAGFAAEIRRKAGASIVLVYRLPPAKSRSLAIS